MPLYNESSRIAVFCLCLMDAVEAKKNTFYGKRTHSMVREHIARIAVFCLCLMDAVEALRQLQERDITAKVVAASCSCGADT